MGVLRTGEFFSPPPPARHFGQHGRRRRYGRSSNIYFFAKKRVPPPPPAQKKVVTTPKKRPAPPTPFLPLNLEKHKMKSKKKINSLTNLSTTMTTGITPKLRLRITACTDPSSQKRKVSAKRNFKKSDKTSVRRPQGKESKGENITTNGCASSCANHVLV